MDQNRRLDEYQRLQKLAVSEFTSQPYCDTPGCTTHHTPGNSPTKNKKFETSKTSAIKRKDNEEGYTSPSNRQIAKNRMTSSQAELNFKIDLRNKFQNLKIDQIAGSSSSTNGNTQVNSTQSNSSQNKNQAGTNTTKKYLPSPVFLKITDNYRKQIKTLNDRLPALRSKMTGEYFKLYTDTDDQHHELNKILEELNYEFYSITPKRQTH
ncbi:hypothetical protein TNIN_332381 [Trichonephila inaurata madagascariensis]|uniref:Uncharacterized protein n=1 Tax=Trichonephila inaurata madagascariensis TaxID=2747483 RepID=A0A8X7C0B0_9ARAC|nr:hypothetical protein TNIN_332381 [Trichonephila inaurata madagascariensis]